MKGTVNVYVPKKRLKIQSISAIALGKDSRGPSGDGINRQDIPSKSDQVK